MGISTGDDEAQTVHLRFHEPTLGAEVGTGYGTSPRPSGAVSGATLPATAGTGPETVS